MQMRVLTVFLIMMGGVLVPSISFAQAGYDELKRLNEKILDIAEPELAGGVPDFSESAINEQKRAVEAARKELRSLDVSSWPVSGKADYLIVWSKLKEIAFDHRVMKPWARDPLVYLYQVNNVPYADVPASEAERTELRDSLQSVPRAMANAQRNLTSAVGQLARLTIFHLENFDGVGQGQPYRDDPPEGTIGWFNDLCQRLRAADEGGLVDVCREATQAVEGYRDWLVANLDEMKESPAIGGENFDWYLKHVRLLPFSKEDLKVIGERELNKYRFKYLAERGKNASLDELTLTQNAEQHERRTRRAERKIRNLIAEHDLLTIPDYMPSEFETDTFWSPRAKTDRHFWEELQFRNALNNHIHASIPGHRFDARMRERLENPIRRTHGDSARAEGWATYIEELFLQFGIAQDNPRVRELFYIALIKRGSRFSEIDLHTGKMSFDDAIDYMIKWVPYMEEDLGRYDLTGYLRRPGLGSMYIIGKSQIEKLVSERADQLGEHFDLGEFHDDFLSRGIIPVTLIRWEMTGYDDEVETIWEDVVGKPFPAASSHKQ